ncbi:unnamed protein product [Bursaphelenchus xylophilus]|uniref:(pine wood nematode) hypothetical protein n=1 Tax=Bursaphelenchus xylophilus TaxID=6326 RepID=A0A1I7S575_BURXY|nr:unnamed protein product [Bursaphelenchus xylophilus]CAG9117780.1 unnamed protein product [Bursaphelenchus xylophilus]
MFKLICLAVLVSAAVAQYSQGYGSYGTSNYGTYSQNPQYSASGYNSQYNPYCDPSYFGGSNSGYGQQYGGQSQYGASSGYGGQYGSSYGQQYNPSSYSSSYRGRRMAGPPGLVYV